MTQASNESRLVFDDLLSSFKLTKSQSTYISNRVSRARSPETPQSVLNFFQKVGLSEPHIKSAVRRNPQLLFSNVEKNLKPKIEYFQRLGIVGSDLGKFLCRSSPVLKFSLEKTLIPFIEFLEKVLYNDEDNKNLVQVLRLGGMLLRNHSDSRLVRNITFLESCGIFGSRLSLFLVRQPLLFVLEESKVIELVSQTLDMGVSINSKMFVQAIHSISCLSSETIRIKLEFIQSFGFSKDESIQMFRRERVLLRVSEEKLKFGIEFYLHTVKMNKSVLVRSPSCLMYSKEDRVIPRYRVFQVIISKRLLNNKIKQMSFLSMVSLSEERFLEFISEYGDNAEQLSVAYKVRHLDVPSTEKS